MARRPGTKQNTTTGTVQRSPADIVFREVTSATWTDFETLFEGRGGPKSCWCMVWRATPEQSRDVTGPNRKSAIKKRVDAGIPVGILGYQKAAPVAWCSIAPRNTYRPGLADSQERDEDENIWSLVCFYVQRAARGQGVLKGLIEAAKHHARAYGATVLEAYPVDPDSPSYRFGGFLPTFEETEFVRIGRAGSRRHIVRHRLK
jgi:GNAT superfamily N-acetyltransferase